MSQNSLTDLLAQKAALEKQIADVQREQRSQAITQVRALMTEYGLTLADIGSKGPAPAAAKKEKGPSKVAAKYLDPVTGSTWSGRGLKPKWLTAALAGGRDISEFSV